MMIGFPTIAIGELRMSNAEFTLNETEASWFGELPDYLNRYMMMNSCRIYV